LLCTQPSIPVPVIYSTDIGMSISFFVKDDNRFDIKKIVSENWIEPPKRERKRK